MRSGSQPIADAHYDQRNVCALDIEDMLQSAGDRHAIVGHQRLEVSDRVCVRSPADDRKKVIPQKQVDADSVVQVCEDDTITNVTDENNAINTPQRQSCRNNRGRTSARGAGTPITYDFPCGLLRAEDESTHGPSETYSDVEYALPGCLFVLVSMMQRPESARKGLRVEFDLASIDVILVPQ
jgi:hypothetical protein